MLSPFSSNSGYSLDFVNHGYDQSIDLVTRMLKNSGYAAKFPVVSTIQASKELAVQVMWGRIFRLSVVRSPWLVKYLSYLTLSLLAFGREK